MLLKPLLQIINFSPKETQLTNSEGYSFLMPNHERKLKNVG